MKAVTKEEAVHATQEARENRPSPQETLREDFAKQQEEHAELARALERYPKLHRYRDRWGNVYYATEEVNERVTECCIKHNCGCCADSPLEVYPYLEEEGLRIYSDPTCFQVGQKYAFGIGEVPYDNWQERLRAARIPDAVIAKIEKMFAEDPPVDVDPYGSDSWEDDEA